ncbi:MAG: hypothetical protein ACRDI2_08890 [Chloroflexota bacterium]
MAGKELLRPAIDYASKQGRPMKEYEVASVVIKNGSCWINFQAKNGGPGEHFTVCVDVATGRATELIPGE